MVIWNEIYREHGIVQRQPELLITNHINLLKGFGNKVYDYGAGTGRNALYLAKEGFEVFTYDPSPLSRDLLSKSTDNGLKSRTHILQFPLNGSSSIDISLAMNSIHHGNYAEIIRGVSNLIAPVRKGGLVLFKGLSYGDSKSQYGVEIEERTRKNIPHWKDGSVPHHFFIKDELKHLFAKLDIIYINETKESVEFFEDMPHKYFELVARKL